MFPLKNLETFIGLIKEHSIKEIILTGTNTDPLLYRHQKNLLKILRENIQNIQISVHTNGFLILKQLSTFEMYDKCTLSLPSFSEDIFQIMMGTKQRVLNLKTISEQTSIALKVSRIVDNTNNTLKETNNYLEHISKTRIKRIAFRKIADDESSWENVIKILEAL